MQGFFKPKNISVLLLFVVVFFAGLYIGKNKNNQTPLPIFGNEEIAQPVGVDFSSVWKAWNVLDEKFIPATTTDIVADQDKVWGIIKGLADSYKDPYTVFLPPKESELFEDNIQGRSFGGVGMEIGLRDGILTVIAPLKDTPAYKAGILAGDRIVEIDGKTTQGISVEEAVERIRGEIGTEVELTINRKGVSDFLTILIERGDIKIPTADAELREDGVFVIELYTFNANAGNAFRGALREFVISGSNKLILDLRGNPGGFLEISVDIASWFLPTGKVVVQEDFGDGENTRFYRSRGYNIFNENLKMVILTNQGSASASEILAGALQEHGIATILGTQTFGKGSVQELVKITPETSLKVTIARWLTPNARSISDGGLTPDIMVEMTNDDIQAGRDPQLEKAVEFLISK